MLVPGAALTEAPASPVRLVENIQDWMFFPPRKTEGGVSIVGSAELDRYLAVPDRKLPVVRRILSALRQFGTIEEAANQLAAQGLKVDVGDFVTKLRKTGLVLDESGQPVKPDSDLERSMFRFGSVRLDFASRIFAWLGTSTGRRISAVALLLVTILALAVVGVRGGAPTAGSLLAGTYWSRLLWLVVCFLAHELSHGVMAAALGRPPRRFEFGLYLGFLPTFYLKIGRLYTLPPAGRIAVWAAGPVGNLVLAAALAAVAAVAPAWRPVLHQPAVVSAGIGLFNLFPFLPTDGYYLMSTALQRYNVRRNAWAGAKQLLGGQAAPSAFPMLYFLVMAATIAYLLGSRLWKLSAAFQSHPIASGAQLAAIVIAACILYFRVRRRGSI